MSMQQEQLPFGRAVWTTLPRQHGAWTALLACFLLGVIVAGKSGHESLYLLLVIVAVFSLREGAAQLLRRRPNPAQRLSLLEGLAFWAAMAFLAALALWRCNALAPLLPSATVGALLFTISLVWFGRRRRDEMSLPGEMLGMAGLSLAAPAAEAVATGGVSERTVGLWLLSLMFFEASVLHVRHVVRDQRACRQNIQQRISTGISSMLFHIGAMSLATLLARFGWIPHLAPLALIPALLKSALPILVRRTGPVRIVRVGLVELGHTVAFVALCSFLYLQQVSGIQAGQ